ncbi:MAG: DUF3551 domain-containing protein [Hyphomicrobiales bacterium]|nr:DUF3551 domain-containing protein [Hyphomicrobiales bacterium]
MRLNRLVVVGLAAAGIALTIGAELAAAQRAPRPWCLQSGRGGPGGGLPDCNYYTLQQCLAAVGGGGEGCFRNPALGWDRIEGKRAPRSQGR